MLSLEPREREALYLKGLGYSYQEIAQLSRVADVASVEAAVVSLDDMSSTRIDAVSRFESRSGRTCAPAARPEGACAQSRRR